MTSFIKIIVPAFYLITCVKGEIIWPTNASRKLSSNFGEFRDDHFHMGIDIKTNGQEGYEVYAIADGFISRMVTNYTGYGKALYLKTKSENTAVYCHLSKFSSEGTSQLIVMHDINLAAEIADIIVLMSHGRVIEAGPPAEVLTTEALEKTFQAPMSVLQDGEQRFYKTIL